MYHLIISSILLLFSSCVHLPILLPQPVCVCECVKVCPSPTFLGVPCVAACSGARRDQLPSPSQRGPVQWRAPGTTTPSTVHSTEYSTQYSDTTLDTAACDRDGCSGHGHRRHRRGRGECECIAIECRARGCTSPG